ncbi:MAG: hypothetical protein ACREM9_05595 [Gemmatimonadales bacterium]
MLHVLVLVAACAGETTAPEAPATPNTPATPTTDVGFRVLPGTVTIETDQRIRFRVEFRTRQARGPEPTVRWEASGGSIDSRGTFYSSRPGTFRIVGRGGDRARGYYHRPDTSIVVVVRKQPGVIGIRVTPRVPRMGPGEKRTFTAVGLIGDGTTVPIGVTWAATGGTIDAGGVYRAGAELGTYRVIATNTRGTLADTIPVLIRTLETTDTTGSGTPEPAPALARVVLKPGSVALATLATHRFAAFGRDTAGDSVAVDVTFHATGGTITSTGLYTAGGTAGSYRVIATAKDLADTAVVTLARTSGGETPTPTPAGYGTPMGIFGLLSYDVDPRHYTMAVDGYSAGNVVSRIAQARQMKISLFMNMTGGDHGKYMTDGVFDMSKWRAKMDTYNTPEIRAAIADAVADGIIVGNSVMDEPANTSPSNSWGPEGTMTKERVDGMCRYVKDMFPTLPVGVLHDHRIFEPSKGYQHCEFLVSQYRLSKGDVRDFRDGGLAFVNRYNMSIIFSVNVLHGGTPGTDCEKWGDDPRGILCPVSSSQLRDWGTILGTQGCAFMMWMYEAEYIEKPEIQAALGDVAGELAKKPRRSCARG